MSVSLLKSNPYLREVAKRRAALRISAASSSAVEGIRLPFAEAATPLSAHLRPAPLKRTQSGR